MNTKPILIYLWFFFAAALLTSCDAIIEPSISKKQVNLEAPADHYLSVKYAVDFWWDEVDHALSYRLQVVSDSFAAPGGLILDTIVKRNRFTINFDPGKYQWRVSAQNGSTATPYTIPRSFEIANSSIKGQAVQLASPLNGLLTNQQVQVFNWGSLYGATKYRLQIDTNNFSSATSVVLDQLTTELNFSFRYPADQTFQWRVRAENDTAVSKWSAISNVAFDHTPPGAPVLAAPGNGQTLTSPVALRWNAVASAGKYRLYIMKSDSTTSYSNDFPKIVNTTSYSFGIGLPGEKIYWKVSAIDAAGNEGSASGLRNFTIQ